MCVFLSQINERLLIQYLQIWFSIQNSEPRLLHQGSSSTIQETEKPTKSAPEKNTTSMSVNRNQRILRAAEIPERELPPSGTQPERKETYLESLIGEDNQG